MIAENDINMNLNIQHASSQASALNLSAVDMDNINYAVYEMVIFVLIGIAGGLLGAAALVGRGAAAASALLRDRGA